MHADAIAIYADAARGLVRVAELAAVHAVCMPAGPARLRYCWRERAAIVLPLPCDRSPRATSSRMWAGRISLWPLASCQTWLATSRSSRPCTIGEWLTLGARAPFGVFQEGRGCKIAVAASMSRLSSSLGMAIGLQCPIERSERMLYALQVH